LWPALRDVPFVVFPLAFAISVGLATLSYLHFESRFRRRSTREPAALAGATAGG
jgi:peptidoglycan/LPS O-acetylase OafA/YrhL